MVLTPPATSRWLFRGVTFQQPKGGPPLAYLAAAAPKGLLRTPHTFFAMAEAPEVDPPDGCEEEDA